MPGASSPLSMASRTAQSQPVPGHPHRVVLVAPQLRMPLRLQHGRSQKCCRRGVLGVDLHRDGDEGGHPGHQSGLAAGTLDAGQDDQVVGPVRHFGVQQPLAGEVMIDRRAGQIGAHGDGLERRPVVAALAEDLTRGAHDALARLVSFRCRRTSRPTTCHLRHY